jgi:hypothetical protein
MIVAPTKATLVTPSRVASDNDVAVLPASQFCWPCYGTHAHAIGRYILNIGQTTSSLRKEGS